MREPLDRATVITLVVAGVFAAAIGFAVGVVTTFTHRLAAPWGLLAGIVVVLALVAGFRLVFDSRIIGLAGLVGVLAGTGLLLLPGAGGIALVLDDRLGWLWVTLPAVLSAVIVALPRRSRIETP